MKVKKINVVLFSGFLIGLTTYALLSPNYYIQSLINLNKNYVVLRTLLALALLAYVFFPKLRTYLAKTLMGAAGAVLLVFGVITIFSPTLMGYSLNYISIGDTFIFLEGGVLSMLLSMELPAKPRPATAHLGNLASVVVAQPKKLLSSAGHPTKTAHA